MSGGIPIGRVEEVDPSLDGLADDRDAFVLGKSPCLAAPPGIAEPVGAQAKPGYLQASRAQRYVLHPDMVATCAAVSRAACGELPNESVRGHSCRLRTAHAAR